MCSYVHLLKIDAEQEDMDLPSASAEEKEQSLAGDDNHVKAQIFSRPIKREEPGNVRTGFSKLRERPQCDGEHEQCPLCEGTGALVTSQGPSLGGGREPHRAERSVHVLTVLILYQKIKI